MCVLRVWSVKTRKIATASNFTIVYMRKVGAKVAIKCSIAKTFPKWNYSPWYNYVTPVYTLPCKLL